MITLFTVDRNYTYERNKELTLNNNLNSLPEINEYLARLFPQGLSRHGIAYFWNGKFEKESVNVSIELHLEMHRRAFYPSKPSRFTSMFCCLSLAEAIEFRDRGAPANFPIYEVNCDEKLIHKADMNILSHSESAIVFSQHLDMYWSGNSLKTYIPDHQEFTEVIVPLPVAIGRQVA